MPAASVVLQRSFCLSLLACGGLVAGCDSPRERPTAFSGPPPSTAVSVIAPIAEAVVPADSEAVVIVEASGSVQAVEFFMKRVALPDTLATERRMFDTAVDQVQVTFSVRIPGNLMPGVSLEIRGVADNETGERFVSEPVFVRVFDCQDFPQACEVP